MILKGPLFLGANFPLTWQSCILKTVLSSLVGIGALLEVVALGAAFKADNLGSVGFAWVFRKGGAWGLLRSMGLLPGKGSS
jgi:hypothetical protein